MRSNSYSEKRGRSIRQMTGSGPSFNNVSSINNGRHIASGQIQDDGTTITRRFGEPSTSATEAALKNSTAVSTRDSYAFSENYDDDPYGGIEEEAITFPQSTHSWLFTQEVFSQPFWFAAGIAGMSLTCLILAFLNIFAEEYDPGNPFSVPFQVSKSVRAAQYFAMVISLIMEEEIPTGLYLLRMISKESLSKKFPNIPFWRFVLSAFVRLGMGYLFLFNTFCVVVQATTVLDIFYDVLALQFLQQLDDIAFNLSKIDVFGKTLKHAALSKCFSAEFEKQKFSLRKRMNVFLKLLYFLNLATMLGGMVYVTIKQNGGDFQPRSITVSFGDQIWSDAIVTSASGDTETRTLLFSYFNGVYARSESAALHDGRPVYKEQNKYDNTPFDTVVPAEIKYCRSEEAWVFAHKNIKKNEEDESDCRWLLKSPTTKEYSILDVTGNWAIWTGSLQDNGHFSATDNECQAEVDCNYHGNCVDGECNCTGGYSGEHCELKRSCSLIKGGEGGSWAQVLWADDEMKIYQRPVYRLEEGVPDVVYRKYGVDPVEDHIFLAFTGSRWLGIHYPGTKLAVRPRSFWENYVKNFHAFWEDTYNKRTKFASDPAASQSSIIGIDFYEVGLLGEEFGPFGQLFPLSEPKGSGLMKCVEDDLVIYTRDAVYRGQTADFSVDGIGTIVVEYEMKRGREYKSKVLAKDCSNPITGIDLDMTPTRNSKWEHVDLLSLEYTFSMNQLTGSNIWNANTSKLEFCQVFDYIISGVDSNSTETVTGTVNLITQLVPV